MAHIILPVGISFFTFHGLSYVIDIYRGRIKPNRSPLDFFLYMAFFPQLVAGPIVRASMFMPQLRSARSVSMRRFKFLIALFLVGFFKKAIISDSIAPTIDQMFAAPQLFDAHAHVLGVVLYAVQIYCDFSGYTDMAIAVAGMLGYRFPQNFNAPYLATSITDFWRRWHMSLSSWLRDYLYISLGGNRHGELKTYRNLLLTMGLGGLWHGASWNFLVWGIMHGTALSAERFWHEHASPRHRSAAPGAQVAPGLDIAGLAATGAKWVLTFGFICAAWVLFRSQSFADSAYILGSIFGLEVGRQPEHTARLVDGHRRPVGDPLHQLAAGVGSADRVHAPSRRRGDCRHSSRGHRAAAATDHHAVHLFSVLISWCISESDDEPPRDDAGQSRDGRCHAPTLRCA